MTEAYRITGRRTHIDMPMLEPSGKLLNEVDTAVLLATRVKTDIAISRKSLLVSESAYVGQGLTRFWAAMGIWQECVFSWHEALEMVHFI